MTSRSGSATLRALLAAMVLIAGLAFHTAFAQRDARIEEQKSFRRLWTDLAQAVNTYLDASEPVASIAEGPDPTNDYGDVLIERARLQGLQPYEFWRTLRNKPFLPYRARTSMVAFDDPGRAMLLSLGFRVLGGISPYLILWVALFAAAPVLVWLWIEFSRAGFWMAGTVFSLLVVASPFIVECLSLSRYAVGFYLVAALVSLGLILPAISPVPPTFRASIVRALLAGLILALCIQCRSSCGFMAPGFLAALGLSTYRFPGSMKARLGSFMILALILATPAVLTRPSTKHDVWPPIWEGLGDFDRKYDHAWNDRDARALARASGIDENVDFRMPEAAAVFRNAVIEHVTGDPLWYTTILVKRAASTITLWKLWPFAPIDGEFIRRKSSPNEGMIDKYFTYTVTVDHFGPGRSAPEVPVTLFLIPTAALITLALTRRWRGPARPFVLGIACFSLVLLPLPTLITTAGGQETQAFALVHMLSAAFLAQLLWNRYRRPIGINEAR